GAIAQNRASPQIFAQNLSNIALRQRTDEFDDARHFVTRQPLAHEFRELSLVKLRVAPDDEQLDGLAAARVGHAARGRLAHAGILHRDVVYFAEKGIEAKDVDNVLLAIEQTKKAGRTEYTGIDGMPQAYGRQ